MVREGGKRCDHPIGALPIDAPRVWLFSLSLSLLWVFVRARGLSRSRGGGRVHRSGDVVVRLAGVGAEGDGHWLARRGGRGQWWVIAISFWFVADAMTAAKTSILSDSRPQKLT